MENFSNNFITTLAAPIGASDVSLQVANATGCPAANFRIIIDSEYMLVTNVVGNVFTVTRGIEGSTATAHLLNASVAHILTVGGLKALIEQTAAYNHAQTSASAVWTIPHNLGRFPSIVVTDNLNNLLHCDVFYVDANIAQVIHGVALTGNAYCN